MLKEVKTFIFDDIDKKDICNYYVTILQSYKTNELVKFLSNKYKILENINKDDITRIFPYTINENNKVEIVLDIVINKYES